ncbi:MAG TPA: hypothetical protein VFL57_16315 [Bryobacteraceae bacterium]|nr:hypothetical protein [Bryobacteraceae bacterium]
MELLVQKLMAGVDMVVKLTADEIGILEKALLNHIGSLRDQARQYACTPSGIALCQHRAQAEELLDRLVNDTPDLRAA